MVVACVALIVAMGGTGYAATQLPANSVGTKQLKQYAVTLSKVSKDARTALRGNRGARGPAGPAGPGAKRFFVDTGVNVKEGVVFNSKDFAVSVYCPLDQITIVRHAPANVAVNGSYVYGAKNSQATGTRTVSQFLDGDAGSSALVATGVASTGTATVQSYLPGSDTRHEYTVVATIADEGSGNCAAYGSVTPAS